jgi:hypothetical protein
MDKWEFQNKVDIVIKTASKFLLDWNLYYLNKLVIAWSSKLL